MSTIGLSNQCLSIQSAEWRSGIVLGPYPRGRWIETILFYLSSCDRIVVSTPRCGRGNPGSNPGNSRFFFYWIE
ncbi:unnamed protein product [Clavelina lepadiformis]|uniref:Uncharacterized protein n=1 Tax=Clavelina lepadiformis TaxID=159417 RepID=A0ABP0FTE1_CLALP